MIKIICDRCEAEIDKEGNENELHFTKKRATRFGYDDELNLCDVCIKAFFDSFMKQRKKVK